MDDMEANGAPADGMGQEGYTIEIKVDGSGAISVGVDTQADEMQEADEGQEQYQPVGSIVEALQLAKSIYADSGQMQDSNADKMAMASGYKE